MTDMHEWFSMFAYMPCSSCLATTKLEMNFLISALDKQSGLNSKHQVSCVTQHKSKGLQNCNSSPAATSTEALATKAGGFSCSERSAFNRSSNSNTSFFYCCFSKTYRMKKT